MVLYFLDLPKSFNMLFSATRRTQTLSQHTLDHNLSINQHLNHRFGLFTEHSQCHFIEPRCLHDYNTAFIPHEVFRARVYTLQVPVHLIYDALGVV